MKKTRLLKALFPFPGVLLALAIFTPTPGNAAEAKPAWQVEWARTVEAAKKEGQVTVYTSASFGTIIREGFEKAFPGIQMMTTLGSGGNLTQRVLSERRAGKNLVDIMVSGANTTYQVFYRTKILDPIKPVLILPEVVDRSHWWQRRHWYVDPEEEYVFVYQGNVARVGSYHAKSVNAAEFKSYWDFVNPKWKGEIVARDIRRPGSGGDAMRFFYHHPELGPGFIGRLFGEMEITLTNDNRQGVDWLAQGRFPLGLFLGDVELARQQGLPVGEFDPHLFKEGAPLGIGAGTITLVSGAPHPNAARVFINWYLSREGQLVFQKDTAQRGGGADSMRMDIPKENIPSPYRRREGASYLFMARPELSDMRPILKVVNEALAASRKK